MGALAASRVERGEGRQVRPSVAPRLDVTVGPEGSTPAPVLAKAIAETEVRATTPALAVGPSGTLVGPARTPVPTARPAQLASATFLQGAPASPGAVPRVAAAAAPSGALVAPEALAEVVQLRGVRGAPAGVEVAAVVAASQTPAPWPPPKGPLPNAKKAKPPAGAAAVAAAASAEPVAAGVLGVP